jgi:nucleotide-binding universal stress UspA family protein
MEQTTAVDPIVVGYDGSSSADHALRWAVAEGKLRHIPVRVVHVVEWPVTVAPGDSGWLSEDQMLAAKAGLDLAIARAGDGADEVSIVEGSIVGTLCELSHHASMVVLGARGGGGFSGLLIGSVVLSVAVHASCPVVVVRGGQHPDEHADEAALPVVVGVDDSASGRLAARFAFAEARMRGCQLVAVRAWRPGADPTGELETAERVALRESLAESHQVFPEVPLSLRLVADRPAKTLIDASEQAQLVVVGSRGMGGFRGLLLGSVGQQLLHHAHCPVAVVR